MKKNTNVYVKIMISLLLILFMVGCNSMNEKDKYIIDLDREVYTVKEGESIELQITFTKNGADDNEDLLKFTIDDLNIAETNGKFIYGVSIGVAQITVSYQSVYKTAQIEVVKNNVTISTNKDSYLLLLGNHLNNVQIETEIREDEIVVESPIIAYLSNDIQIATVSNTGLITPLKRGKTTISITFGKRVKEVLVEVLEEISTNSLSIFNDNNLNIYGRAFNSNDFLNVDNPTSGIEVTFYGTYLSADIKTVGSNYVRVYVDDDKEGIFMPISTNSDFKIVDDLSEGLHVVKILKASEDDTRITYKKLFANTFYSSPIKPSFKIEFIGDSITAGFAIFGKRGETRTPANSDATSSYANVAAMILNADLSVIALQGICVSAYHWQPNINMESLYTYYSNSNRTLFDFNDEVDVVVINLGTNDSSYISTKNSSYANKFPNDYKNFLEYIRTKRPNAYIIAIYGFMGIDPYIHDGISSAIDNLNDDKIFYYYDFRSNSSGGEGHPNLQSNIANGEKLANYIKQLYK